MAGSQRPAPAAGSSRLPSRDRRNGNHFFQPRQRLLDERRAPLRVAQLNRDSELARYNMELGRLAEQNRAADVFDVARKMKESGVKPDHMTYDHLLLACGGIGAHVEAWAVLEDMLAVGIEPKRHTFHLMLHVK